jgi:peptidoglycan hydrolase CwlO-like protein
MIIATITAIIFLFGSGGMFSFDVFKDAAKKVVQDKSTVKQIATITKEADKEVKSLHKEIEKASKQLVTMNTNYDLTRDELNTFLAQGDKRREQFQDRLIELRFQAKNLVILEEWEAMYTYVDKKMAK